MKILLASFFIIAGLNHFINPALYLSMMPPYLPFPTTLNIIAGLAEIAGGIGVLSTKTRRPAAIGLIILLIAVFPANIHIAINGWEATNIPRPILIARLPFQLLFIAWVYLTCLRKKSPPSPSEN